MGLRFCARTFSSCGERGPLFIAVRGPLTAAASPVAEHRLQTRRLSNCGSRAQPLRSMWDPPRPGLEPVSPALAGRLPTTAPPGKPQLKYLVWYLTQRNPSRNIALPLPSPKRKEKLLKYMSKLKNKIENLRKLPQIRHSRILSINKRESVFILLSL